MVHLLQSLLEAIDVDLPIASGVQCIPYLLQPLLPLYFALLIHLPVVPRAAICGVSWSAIIRAWLRRPPARTSREDDQTAASERGA